MSPPRVVITGVGLVTSLGMSARETMPRLLAGERGFRPAGTLDTTGYPTNLAAEVHGLWEATKARGLATRGWSRSDALAVLAATEAWEGANAKTIEARRELWVAASTGGMLETEQALTALYRDADTKLDEHDFDCHPISSPADRVHRALGPFSRVRTVCSACSSGAVSIGLALDRLRRGVADVILAGGADAMSRLTFSGFSALASLDPTGARPFDKSRQGLTLGEAAAFVVLEREDDAKKRSAKILGELAGFAVGSEAHHITAPEPSGAMAESVMRAALRDAERDVGEVGYVSAHGTGTPLNDAMEGEAIARLAGERAKELRVSSPKGQLGHTLAAAGAVQVAVTLLALREHAVPPNGGFAEADPALTVGLAGATSEATTTKVAISNSFGFGGTDASLVVSTELGAPRAIATPSQIETVITGAATLGPLPGTRSADATKYLEAQAPGAPRNADDPKAKLDPASARRLDVSARYAVFLAQEALSDAALVPDARTGLVTGTAFASSDASAAFFARIADKGPRFASPLEFPNLVPSSPGAHAAIVTHVQGPALAVADLGATALTSLETAVDLLASGRCDAVVSMASEAPNLIAERRLSAALTKTGEGARGSGGAALVLESATHAKARGAKLLAKVVDVGSLRGGARSMAAPRGRAAIFVAEKSRTLEALANELGWGGVSIRDVASAAGWHEAALAIAAAAAVSSLANGEFDEALLLFASPDRFAFARLLAP